MQNAPLEKTRILMTRKKPLKILFSGFLAFI